MSVEKDLTKKVKEKINNPINQDGHKREVLNENNDKDVIEKNTQHKPRDNA